MGYTFLNKIMLFTPFQIEKGLEYVSIAADKTEENPSFFYLIVIALLCWVIWFIYKKHDDKISDLEKSNKELYGLIIQDKDKQIEEAKTTLLEVAKSQKESSRQLNESVQQLKKLSNEWVLQKQ